MALLGAAFTLPQRSVRASEHVFIDVAQNSLADETLLRFPLRDLKSDEGTLSIESSEVEVLSRYYTLERNSDHILNALNSSETEGAWGRVSILTSAGRWACQPWRLEITLSPTTGFLYIGMTSSQNVWNPAPEPF